MKNPWVVLAMGVGLSAGACAPEVGVEIEDVDGTSVEIVAVPAGVKCVWLSASGGGKTVQKAFSVGEGPVPMVLGSLPPSSATMTGKAFEAVCPSGGGAPGGAAKWVAPATPFQVVAGLPSHVSITFRLADAPVDGTADFEQAAIMVSPGTNASLALVGDGTLRSWGTSPNGELGTNQTGFYRTTPGSVIDPGFTDLIGVAGGQNRSCAYNHNEMWCWGAAPLGNGSTAPSAVAVLVPRWWNDGSIASMQQGANNTCYVETNSNVWCWGSNAAGQLNAEPSTTPVTSPTRVGSTPWRAFAIGGAFSCAVTGEGRPVCFGDNSYGQLGTPGPSGHQSHYVNLLAIDSIAAGDTHVCARRGDSTVWCWGNNASGQLGNGSNTSSNVPVQVLGLTDAAQVTAGVDFTCALRTNGTVSCWGSNKIGQLGTGNGANATVPVTTMGLTDVVSVNAVSSGYTVCATRKDGAAFCWGYGGVGQIGDGRGLNQFVPSRVDL